MQALPKNLKVGDRDSFIAVRDPAAQDRLQAPVWHVWMEGGEPIGPVSAAQIARGIQAGKVPSHASVRHDTETFWGDLLDSPDIVAALKAVSAESAPPPPPPPPSVMPTSVVPPSIVPASAPPPNMPAALLTREFMVWVAGKNPVGPVSADQIARGIRAGRLPPDASVQRQGALFATDALDEADVIAALKYL